MIAVGGDDNDSGEDSVCSYSHNKLTFLLPKLVFLLRSLRRSLRFLLAALAALPRRLTTLRPLRLLRLLRLLRACSGGCKWRLCPSFD